MCFRYDSWFKINQYDKKNRDYLILDLSNHHLIQIQSEPVDGLVGGV